MRSGSLRRLVVLLLVLGWLAPALAAPVDPELAERFRQLLAQMDAEDWATREKACAAVAALPPDVLPLVEKALRDPKLSPEVRNGLVLIIDDLRRNGAITAKTRAQDKALATYRQFVLGEYDRTGRRDTRWDAAAREGLVMHVALTQARGSVGPATRRRVIDTLRKALDAGCTDPLVRMAYALQRLAAIPNVDQFDAVDDLTRDLLASEYAPQFKLQALWLRAKSRLIQDERRAMDDLEAAEAFIPQLKSAIYTGADGRMLQAWDLFELRGPRRDADRARDRLARLLEEVEPPDSIQPLLFRAYADLFLSRSLGTNSPRLVADRTRALKWATEAAEKDPQSLAAAQLKLAATSPHDDPEAFIREFKAVLAIDPGDFEAHKAMVRHLARNGDTKDLFAFAHRCLETKAWADLTPTLAVDCFSRIGDRMSEEERQAFFATPEVWQTMQAAYEGSLSVYPTDNSLRSYYAYWACAAGQWVTAHQQFELIGEDLISKPFETDADAGYMRRKGKRLAAEAR